MLWQRVERSFVEVQMRGHQLGRRVREPFRQREVLVIVERVLFDLRQTERALRLNSGSLCLRLTDRKIWMGPDELLVGILRRFANRRRSISAFSGESTAVDTAGPLRITRMPRCEGSMAKNKL